MPINSFFEPKKRIVNRNDIGTVGDSAKSGTYVTYDMYNHVFDKNIYLFRRVWP